MKYDDSPFIIHIYHNEEDFSHTVSGSYVSFALNVTAGYFVYF